MILSSNYIRENIFSETIRIHVYEQTSGNKRENRETYRDKLSKKQKVIELSMMQLTAVTISYRHLSF